MSRGSALCAAISAVALLVGIPTMASAATNNKPVAKTNVRTTTVRTNVVRTPQVRTNVRTTTTSTTQIRKTNITNNNAGGGPKFHKPTGPSSVTTTTLKVNPNIKVNTNPRINNPNLHATPALHARPALKLGPGRVNPAVAKINFPVVKLANNKFAPIWKQQHRIWWGGRWRVFAPFTALGVVLVGGAYYYPDAYVGFARPYCAGVTPDGCQLNWQQVNFEDGGGSDWQCVQYCQRPNAVPPPQAVALTPPPPMPEGSCEVTVFSDGNFAGTGVTTNDEQPALSQSGWQNQIASIQVKSGTWDFFSDENFAGQTMRLQPGPYQDLGPEWTRKIGSFVCVQPGS